MSLKDELTGRTIENVLEVQGSYYIVKQDGLRLGDKYALGLVSEKQYKDILENEIIKKLEAEMEKQLLDLLLGKAKRERNKILIANSGMESSELESIFSNHLKDRGADNV